MTQKPVYHDIFTFHDNDNENGPDFYHTSYYSWPPFILQIHQNKDFFVRNLYTFELVWIKKEEY